MDGIPDNRRPLRDLADGDIITYLRGAAQYSPYTREELEGEINRRTTYRTMLPRDQAERALQGRFSEIPPEVPQRSASQRYPATPNRYWPLEPETSFPSGQFQFGNAPAGADSSGGIRQTGVAPQTQGAPGAQVPSFISGISEREYEPARPSAPAVGLPPVPEVPQETRPVPSPIPTQAKAPPVTGPSIEDIIAKRIGTLKPPEETKSFMDSPYLALLQAGLSMMDSRGKSPLEALAGGGKQALQTLGQQRAEQRARGEKAYERNVALAKLENDIRDSAGKVQHYKDQANYWQSSIDELRRSNASTEAIKRAELGLQESRLNLDQEIRRLEYRKVAAAEQRNVLEEGKLQNEARKLDNALRSNNVQAIIKTMQEYGSIVSRLAAGDPTNPDLVDARRRLEEARRSLSDLGVPLAQGTEGGPLGAAANIAPRR